MLLFDADWLRGVREGADRPPARAREALWVEGARSAVGSIEPALAQRLLRAGLPLRPRADGWIVDASDSGSLDAALERVARWLSAEGLAPRWRDERLAVTDASGLPIAAIERAAVRVLGIATQAVHLVGHAPHGAVWVQQRAADKAVDPGLWDTLMGGLTTAAEGIDDTLVRETWEEAGLRLADLEGLAAQGRLTVRRPVDDGYMVEHIHVFAATVPESLVPVNQDGEVARFECLPRDLLGARLVAGGFTLEATLILAKMLQATAQAR